MNNEQDTKIVLDKNNNIYTYLVPIETNEGIIYKSPISGELEKYYIEKGYKVVPYEKGIRISINQDYKDYNVGKWEETTEEEFNEMLGDLPPEEYTVDHKEGIEIFRMSEYLSGNITTHFVIIKKDDDYRCCKGNFDITTYGNITELADKL